MTMMYLEDFVELCEDLHGSMRDHLQEISENDKIIEAELTSVNSEIQNYHSNVKKEVSEKNIKILLIRKTQFHFYFLQLKYNTV